MEPTTEKRKGDSWDAFLKRYRLTNIIDTDRGWDVVSQSGSTYHVRSHTRLDEMGSMYFTMSCTCPAKKQCRHITAVINMREAEARMDEDDDAIEVVERTEID
ncbi:MAG: hypothetical protein RBT66_07685 [bacterium]|jgi:hypothetical protein|nr:hypothetical protein [bacterium]